MSNHLVILSISSDIGLYLGKSYAARGWTVTGTYRSNDARERLDSELPNAVLIKCDIMNHNSIKRAAKIIRQGPPWDAFISAVGCPTPLCRFLDSDFDTWESSFLTNSLRQLSFFHAIYSACRKSKGNIKPSALFFAGGATNSAISNFSAYSSAKIHLIKMIELLAFEDQDVKYCILGPGWTKTKTHDLILRNTAPGTTKHQETLQFLEDEHRGTPFGDIFRCIDWIIESKENSMSGRNISIVHDPWRIDKGRLLEKEFALDENLYKLRRSGNSRFLHHP